MPITIEASAGEIKEKLERVSLVRAALKTNKGLGSCAIGECSSGIARILSDMQPNDDFTRHPVFPTEQIHALRHMIIGNNDDTFDLRIKDGVPDWVTAQMPPFAGEVGGAVDHLAYVGSQVASHALHRVGLIEVSSVGQTTVPEATRVAIAYENFDIRSAFDRAVFDMIDTDEDWQAPREFTEHDLTADGYHGAYLPHAADYWWAALEEDMSRYFPPSDVQSPIA